MPESATILCFDFGLKRIGVAVGNTVTGQARALTTLCAEGTDARFRAIGALLGEWQPARVVVGRPLSLAGDAHDLTRRAQRFANQLRGRFNLTVVEVDERLSSVEAEANLRGQGGWRTRDKGAIDAEAARIILQDYLDTHASASS